MKDFKKNFKSGVQRQPEDKKDIKFKRAISRAEFPSKYLNPGIAEIEDQGGTGSCVANATCSSLEMMIRDQASTNLSRMFVYYNAREPYEFLKEVDNGAYVRDGYKSVNALGVCDETVWPFVEKEVNTKPSDVAYERGINNKVIEYARVATTLNDIKAAVLEGNGVIYATPLDESFFTLSGPLADQNYKGVTSTDEGHHAMSIVGYDDSLGGFIIENSWGTSWGDKGLFLSKYSDFLRDSYDIWTVTSIEFNDLEDYIPEPEPEPEDFFEFEEPGFFEKIINFIKSIFRGIFG